MGQMLSAQIDEESKQSEDNRIKVKNSDNFIAERLDGDDFQYFKGNVKMFQDSIYMFADSAYIHNNEMTAVGEVIIIQEDTINVFADSLYYDADLKLAKLFDNVVMKSADKSLFTNRLVYNLDTKIATFRDTAILKRETMTLSSLKGRYNLNNKRAEFFEEVVIVDEDFKLTADSLEYDTDIDRVYFKGPTYVTQKARQIFCEDGYYDIITQKAFFSQNAVVVDGSKVAFADDILYSEVDSTVIFQGKAEVRDSSSVARGDKITFDDKTGDVEIIGQGYYEQDGQVIEGDFIQFNQDTEDLYCAGRSTILSDSGTLTADTVSYQKILDLGHAVGEVIWQDTVEDVSILTDKLFYKDSTDYFKATAVELRPLFMQMVDGDTLYVSADTLVSAQPSDSLKYIEAINNVQIFKKDLQAVCDSMYYSSIDSVFTLFGSPVCWSDTTQFKGDTIVIKLKNSKVSEIIAKQKGFITTKHRSDYYDQIKGRLIHSFLDSNELKRMEIKGNAEALYLIKDEEKAYVGANKTLCSHMTFFFIEEELDNIKFYTQPESEMTPMEKATKAALQLEGFKWEQYRRPLDISSLRDLKTNVVKVRPEAEELDSFGLDVLKVLEGESGVPLDKPVKEEPVGSSKQAIESDTEEVIESGQRKGKVVK